MKTKTIHSKISYYLIWIAVLVEAYLGIWYLIGGNESDRLFGQLCIYESIFAFVGLFLPDLIRYKRVSFRPKNKDFRPLQEPKPKGIWDYAFFRIIFTTIMLMLVQALLQYVPLTVRDIDKALATAFAGPAEESGFRAGILVIFFTFDFGLSIQLSKKRSLSLMAIIGILVSSVLWMYLHTNYYNYLNLMIAVFLSGVVLGFLYWLWDDITSMVLAHFTLNLIYIFQTIFLVNF